MSATLTELVERVEADIAYALTRRRDAIESAWRTDAKVVGWRGLKAQDRCTPLTDLGVRMLALHLATHTPKDR